MTNTEFWRIRFLRNVGNFWHITRCQSLESIRYVSDQITWILWVVNHSVLWEDGVFLIQAERSRKIDFFKLAYRRVNILTERHKQNRYLTHIHLW